MPTWAWALALALVLGAAVLAAGCGGGSPASSTRRLASAGRTLPGARPCRHAPGFDCASLAVALDPSGGTPGRLRLRVAAQRVRRAPHVVLVALAGGPGQGGVALVNRIWRGLAGALRGYRLVMLDQRGTGSGALRSSARSAPRTSRSRRRQR